MGLQPQKCIRGGRRGLAVNTSYVTPRPLDLFPDAALALGLRALSVARLTSPIPKVRRSSDNAQADAVADLSDPFASITDNSGITVTSGSSSETALGAFVREGSPTSNGRAPTLFDQSGSAINFSQATAGNQPRLYINGALVTAGGRPALDFAGNDGNFLAAGSTNLLRNVTGATVWWAGTLRALDFRSIFAIAINSGTLARLEIIQLSNGAFRIGGRRLDGDSFLSFNSAGSLYTAGTRCLLVARLNYTAGTIELRLNGTPIISSAAYHSGGATSDTASGATRICGTVSANLALNALFQSAGVYHSRLSDDETARFEQALSRYLNIPLA